MANSETENAARLEVHAGLALADAQRSESPLHVLWRGFAMDVIRRNKLQMAVCLMVTQSGYFHPSEASDADSARGFCHKWCGQVASQEVQSETLLQPATNQTSTLPTCECGSTCCSWCSKAQAPDGAPGASTGRHPGKNGSG